MSMPPGIRHIPVVAILLFALFADQDPQPSSSKKPSFGKLSVRIIGGSSDGDYINFRVRIKNTGDKPVVSFRKGAPWSLLEIRDEKGRNVKWRVTRISLTGVQLTDFVLLFPGEVLETTWSLRVVPASEKGELGRCVEHGCLDYPIPNKRYYFRIERWTPSGNTFTLWPLAEDGPAEIDVEEHFGAKLFHGDVLTNWVVVTFRADRVLVEEPKKVPKRVRTMDELSRDAAKRTRKFFGLEK